MQGYGALGNFSAIGSTAKSIVNTPDWMLNLRMSGFGQGLANMHTGISGAISGITSGWGITLWVLILVNLVKMCLQV